jgi:hypothetical protein
MIFQLIFILSCVRLTQLRCFVAASKNGRYSPSGLTSSQGGDHLTTTSYADRCFSWYFLQLLAPRLNWFPTAKFQIQLSIIDWRPSRINWLGKSRVSVSAWKRLCYFRSFVILPTCSSIHCPSINLHSMLYKSCTWRNVIKYIKN